MEVKKYRWVFFTFFGNTLFYLLRFSNSTHGFYSQVTLSRADSLLDDSRPPDIDLAVLKSIKTTAKRSTQLNHGLKDMKLRIHNMERLAGY